MGASSSESAREFAERVIAEANHEVAMSEGRREAERDAAEKAQLEDARSFLKCMSGIGEGMTDPYEKMYRRDYEKQFEQGVTRRGPIFF
jgi:hypothetical protein